MQETAKSEKQGNSTTITNDILKDLKVPGNVLVYGLRPTAVAVGSYSYSGVGSVSLGNYALSTKKFGVSVGFQARATNGLAIAVGAGSLSSGREAQAYGRNATARGIKSIAQGVASYAEDDGAIAIGSFASAIGENSIAIGSGNKENKEYPKNFTTTKVTALGKNSIALGHLAVSRNDNSLALGYKSFSHTDNGVALGSDSSADVEKGIEGYKASKKYGRLKGNVLKSTHSAISIGKGKDITRQLTGLAAGKEDTDAVNVAQLKSLAEQTTTFKVTEGTEEVKKNSDKKVLEITETKENIFKDNVKYVGTNLITKITSTNGKINISIGLKENPEFKEISAKDENGNNTKITSNGLTITPKDGNVVSLTKDGLDNGGKVIKNVGAGTSDTDGVNLKQLKDSRTEVKVGNNSSLTVNSSYDNAKNKYTYTLDIKSDNKTIIKDKEHNLKVNVGSITTEESNNKIEIKTSNNEQIAKTGDVVDAINRLGNNALTLLGDKGSTDSQTLNKSGGLNFKIKGSETIKTTAKGNEISIDLTDKIKEDIEKGVIANS
ncbi:hypothetical protein KX935_04265 [Streptobacillus moniliformis]|uniref:hypothetical protein n=1 Tax=Streptobacillus moniliformis TaxID=34105 RepID=UPI0007E2DE30|nr:hypothetical protein [Streptobacillus moniliformis]QXW65068.1 hypothetical protein KX935_04265 [Streptobacillus moniliformis]